MHGPIFRAGPLTGDCGYAGNTGGAKALQVTISAFPERRGPRTLHKAKSQIVGLYNMGTAKDKKTQRIMNEPRFGPGAFLWAFIVVAAGGPAEDVNVYTHRWHLFVNYPTRQLLTAHELSDAARLLATLPS